MIRVHRKPDVGRQHLGVVSEAHVVSGVGRSTCPTIERFLNSRRLRHWEPGSVSSKRCQKRKLSRNRRSPFDLHFEAWKPHLPTLNRVWSQSRRS